MKIISKHLENISLPLPIFQAVHIADAVSKDGEEFEIIVGLLKKYTEQLQELSLDESDEGLQKNTNDRERFGTGSYEEWYKKNRTPFGLIHKKTDALAALVWFGPKPLHEGCKCHSVGWRSYRPFRGKGLMKEFTGFAIDFYSREMPNVKFWVAIKRRNTGSADLASTLGFVVNEEYTDDESIIMTTYKEE